MTTDELRKELIELGYDSFVTTDHVIILNADGGILARVHLEIRYVIDTLYKRFLTLDENERKKIIKLLNRYSNTPIKDRVEKKYYWALKEKGDYEGFGFYMNINRGTGKLVISDRDENDAYRTKFTETEYNLFVMGGKVPDIFMPVHIMPF